MWCYVSLVGTGTWGLSLTVNHDDGRREFYYPDPALLKLATVNDWQAISILNDFKTVLP